MKLDADEGVDKPIFEALRFEGFDVLYIAESYLSANDAFILNLSNEPQRVLLTQDKDFGELVFRLGSAHFGVVLIRLTRCTAVEKADIVVKVVLEHQVELIKAFTVIQPKAVLIRRRT